MLWSKKPVNFFMRLNGWALAVLVAVLAPGLTFAQSVKPPPRYNEFRPTASLHFARSFHTATRVPNVGVLVTGGYADDGEGNTIVINTCEIFRPATPVAVMGTAQGWTKTGSLKTPRSLHTATLLTNGQVLVAGGYNFGYPKLAELYNWRTRKWVNTTGKLKSGREAHTATLLPSGEVLLAGGFNGSLEDSLLKTCELFNPGSGTFSKTGNLRTARDFHTATLLYGGKVLAAGGFGLDGALNKAELFDPSTKKWTVTGKLRGARTWHTATLLRNGQVLVAGGFVNPLEALQSAELYDPATGKWKTTGSLNMARRGHKAVLLPNGKVLVTGGVNSDGPIDTAELFDPNTGTWAYTDSLGQALANHTATVISDGKVLVAGGEDAEAFLNSARLYGVGATFIDPLFKGLGFD